MIDRSEVSPANRDQSPDHDQSPDPNRDQSEVVARARARARAVISNHHNLLLALPGRAADWTAADRLRLAASSPHPPVLDPPPPPLPPPPPSKGSHEHHRDPDPTTPGELTAEQLELSRRAAEFVDNVLIPLELEAEESNGRLPEETIDEIRRAAIAARLHGGRVPVEHGGQGWSMVEWFLVNEQFGRVTNGLHWHVPNIYNVLLSGTPEQVER